MKKILIVEDNKDILDTTAEILTIKGFEVIKAAHGKEGLKLAKSDCPALIISDIMMPTMDGYQMLKALRSDADTALIPFVFLTAKSQKIDILVGAITGADRYLTKPFTVEELLKTIDAVIGIKD